MKRGKIAAVMSVEWREPFLASMKTMDMDVTFFPPETERLPLDTISSLSGLVVELSDCAPVSLIAQFQSHGVAVSGLPVSPESEVFSSRWGVDVVLSDEAQAQLWLSQLATSSSPKTPIVVVWGASGSPGRSATAIKLAFAAREHGATTVLDCDLESPSLAESLSVEPESSGLLTLLRCARVEKPDVAACLASMVQVVPADPRLNLVSGIYDPRVLTSAEAVSGGSALKILASSGTVVVVDLRVSPYHPWDSPCRKLEHEVLSVADRVIAVVSETDVGIIRFAREWGRLEAREMSCPVTALLRPVSEDAARKTNEYQSALWELTGMSDIRALSYSPMPREHLRGVSGLHHCTAVTELLREVGVTPPVDQRFRKSRWSRLSLRLFDRQRETARQ